jgi:hypothetical protein
MPDPPLRWGLELLLTPSHLLKPSLERPLSGSLTQGTMETVLSAKLSIGTA